MTLIGEELEGPRRLLGLELTPKDDDLRRTVSRLRLWIDQASWMPARTELELAASGETLTVRYRAMARNLRLNPDLFDDDWPKGTQKLKR